MNQPTFEDLLAASSFGTPDAVAVRAETDPAIVARVLELSDRLSKLPPPPPAEQTRMKERLIERLNELQAEAAAGRK